MHEELREYFERRFRLLPEDFTYGDGITGTTRLTNALSTFLNSYFRPHLPVSPDYLIMGTGLLPMMSQVARAVADRGEGILLAAPYYQGFDDSLVIENGVIPVGISVPPSGMNTMAELVYLERGLLESKSKGVVIRAVIVCNPHNPLGFRYSRNILIGYARLCEKYNLHLICDEVYALSVFPSCDVPQPQPFVSVLSLDLQALGIDPSRVHILYGMSKDFNADGFRAGVFISQSNLLLLQNMTVAAKFTTVASPTDALWSALLTDKAYLPAFFRRNQAKLREAYEYMTQWLTFHGLPYIPSCAGHFLMVDMRPVLSDHDRYASILSVGHEDAMREKETALYNLLLAHKVTVIPGAVMHTAEAGWFRFTFSVRREFTDVGLSRIERALRWCSWKENASPASIEG
ncbi:hypothetical protein IEO21_07728 [Rhodonia placenta]|uniref:Aminotransferase class I/classII large domain-containing protein n=1 Tax=Rhodonia placenta TaxID=104341 RepID=A0A8H7NXL7_9APHY|nr:hypothetical protein IEO21_07728 [Postia placenta]